MILRLDPFPRNPWPSALECANHPFSTTSYSIHPLPQWLHLGVLIYYMWFSRDRSANFAFKRQCFSFLSATQPVAVLSIHPATTCNSMGMAVRLSTYLQDLAVSGQVLTSLALK